MPTIRVTITIDEGVYQDAQAAATEHGMSISAWITRCTRLETMRDALARHQQWCAEEGLAGSDYEQHRGHLAVDAAAELDRLSANRSRDTSRPGSRVVTEPIPDVGQAVLDRISALPRTWLVGDEPLAQLHPDRHADVGRRICNLIGP